MKYKCHKALCVVFLYLFSQNLLAQDERFTRKMLSGDLSRIVEPTSEGNYLYKVRSPYYEIDLNGDNRSESFSTEKKDGEDWISVYDYHKKKIYTHRLEATGPKSRLYRITSKRLSNKTKVYVLHFFEGINDHLNFKTQARFYFLTIDNNDLKTLATYKGPAFWEEFKSFRFEHYRQRSYELTAVDFNKDGTKELSLSYKNIKRVYFYLGKGSWRTF